MAHRRTKNAPRNPRRAPAKPVTLRLEKLAWGGDAIAHLEDGRIVFVDGGFPGQTVEAQLVSDRKRFCKARLLRVIDAPIEAGPACPTADRCGGCRFQGVPYATELTWKIDALQNMLSRIGKDVPWPELTVNSDAAGVMGYRTRVRLRVDADAKTGYLGRGSHDFVPAIRCDVLHPALEAARDYAGYLAADLPGVHRVRMEWDDVRERVVVEIPAESDTWKTLRTTVRQRLEERSPASIVYQDRPVALDVTLRDRGRWEPLRGEGTIAHAYAPATVVQESGQFAQGNTALNARLRARIADWTTRAWDRSVGAQRVVDLFSGAGNFAFAIAERGARVVAIDHAAGAIDAGEAANTMSGPGRVTLWVGADLSAGPFDALRPHFSDANAVVLDPPRGGLCADLLEEIQRSSATTLVYVSCDPPALARDCARLNERGWHVDAAEAWDMFPRTAHVEMCVRLTRARG